MDYHQIIVFFEVTKTQFGYNLLAAQWAITYVIYIKF
jgi:hypothetical protein